MKTNELKNKINAMTPQELYNKLKESKEELFHLRFQMATGHLEDTSKLRQVKKTIARVETAMRSHLLGITRPNRTKETKTHMTTKKRTIAEGRNKSNAGTQNKKS